MNREKWKKTSSKVLLEHPRLKVVEDDIILPNGSLSTYVHFTDTQDATMLVCIKDDAILIQTEYSYPPEQYMYQLPGGAIESRDSDPILAGLRELEEESGYIADEGTNVQYLGSYFTNNRRSSAKHFVILVENPVNAGVTKWDPEEYIESEWIKLEELRGMIGRGEVVNSSILTGLALYDNRSK